MKRSGAEFGSRPTPFHACRTEPCGVCLWSTRSQKQDIVEQEGAELQEEGVEAEAKAKHAEEQRIEE